MFKLKERDRAAYFSPSENWCLPASNLKLEEREFVFDSSASMHMIGKPMKQMFDMSEKLITEQSDEIYGVETTDLDDSEWKHLFLIGGEEVVSLSRAKVYVCSDSVLCFGKELEPTSKYSMRRQIDVVLCSPEYTALDRIDGEPMEFEWNIFPGFTTLQLCHEVQVL